MKKIIILVVLGAVLMASCATAPRSYHGDLTPPSFNLPREINEWVYDNIQYDNIPKTIYTYQTAEQTLKLGHGVCYDMAVLEVKLLKDNGYGYCNPHVVIIRKPGASINHVIVDVGALGYWDPTWGQYIGYDLPAGTRIISE